jgi:16S rRNA (cytosine1402-N4)-methyltransferase
MITLIDETNMPETGQSAADREDQPYHRPVLLGETMAVLRPAPGKLFVDGTVGGGGHARGLLEAGAEVIACDQDPEALAEAALRLEAFGSRVRLVESNFAELEAHLEAMGVRALDGALLDLGVSSHQLDSAERGFSFQQDGPLDMRMSPRTARSAADWVNETPEAELIRIFREYGEEPAARRIARHLVRERVQHRFGTTLELATVIERVVPRRGARHPATRVFQALRIAVNDELTVLIRGLEALSRWIVGGGRLAVITFHSLEDRIVKTFFRRVTTEWLDRPEWPHPKRNPEFAFRSVTPRPIEAAEEEINSNPRARSAKLRVIERIHPDEPQSPKIDLLH